MSSLRIRVSFKNYKDTDLEQKAQHIMQCMTGNANFTNPTPTLAEVQTCIDKYAIALGNVVDGSKQDTVIKNQTRVSLESLLHNLGLFVQLNSKDDEAIMLSSGFDLSKTPAPVGVLPKPANFSTGSSSIKGNVDLSVNPIKGASAYQFEYTETPVTDASNWHTVSSTTPWVTIPNLTSGKEYAFRVTGVGSDPTRVYSDVINKVAPF